MKTQTLKRTVWAAVFFGCACFGWAQTGQQVTGNTAGSVVAPQSEALIELVPLVAGDSVAMLGNALILLQKDGDIQRVNFEMILSNGTRLLPTGTIIFRTGVMTKLSNGQMLTASGDVIPAPASIFRAATVSETVGR